MSVIFKTLEKLGRTSGEGDANVSKQRRHRNVFTFKNFIFSIRGILGIGLIALAVVLVTLYGISYIRSTGGKVVLSEKEREPPEHINVYHGDETSLNNETRPLEAPLPRQQDLSEDIPTPPDFIPVKKAGPGKLYLPSSRKSGSALEQNNYARYLPPKNKMDSNQLSLEKEKGSLEVPAETPPGVSTVEGQRMAGPPLYLRPAKPHEIVNEPGRVLQKTDLIKTGEVKPLLPLDPDIERTGQPVRPEVPPASPGLSMPPTAKQATTGRKNADKGESEKINVAKMEKSARICRLVANFQEAMLTKDNGRVETIIDELASLKGERSDYIIKLKAFWRMKQGDYGPACSLLNSLLQKNENDLEAGINMAVIEIKTHRLDQAGKRLERLRDIYQDNVSILSLLQKIGK
jgi:hypothetical protein